MNRLPSTSSIVAPEPRVTKSGVPPTDLNARTGLSTPPGRMREARVKSVRLVEVFMIQIVRIVRGILIVRTIRTSVAQDPRSIPCVVGDDDVRAGSLDGGERLEHRAPL